MPTSSSSCPVPIRAWFAEALARDRTPGLQYVAMNAAGEVASCSLGMADLAARRPMAADTTLMAYSMSKTITAIAVLQLAERGLVSLDASLTTYVPSAPYGDSVTVRDLIAHTSGLPNPIPLRWVHAAEEHAAFDERAAMAAVLAAHPRLAHEPGSRSRYSNIGYWLLGAVVERVTNGSFAAYVAGHVVEPLGLSARDLGFTIPALDRHATGYLERWSPANLFARWLIDTRLLGAYHGRWRRIGDHYPNGPAFGGLVGTASAFGRLLRDQLQPRSVLLGDAGRGWLYESQHTRAGAVVPMTLGWHVGALDGASTYFKEGGGGGFHCLMRLYPSRGLGSVVMTNATGFDVTRCLDAVDPLLPQWGTAST